MGIANLTIALRFIRPLTVTGSHGSSRDVVRPLRWRYYYWSGRQLSRGTDSPVMAAFFRFLSVIVNEVTPWQYSHC